jgi:transcription elongation factor GreA
MTPWGHKKLKRELKRIREVERPANVRDIEEARSHGDLSENAEYDAAKERQAFLDHRMRELETKLALAQVIDPMTLKGQRVVFGATVSLFDIDSEQEACYMIVGEDESDAKAGLISYKSPMARALIGKEIDDMVRVKTPKGVRQYEIIEVEFKPLNGDHADQAEPGCA